jgi:hypothetical protein
METLIEDAPPQGDEQAQRDPLALIEEFRAAVAGGEPWVEALFATLREWSVPRETVDEREYVYLVAGEAFDWLTLAERVCETATDLIPEEEREALLFSGLLPPGYDDAAFREAIGPAKHRLHRNYFYGVTVEEALQLSFEEDVQKEGRCRAWGGDARSDESAFERIYFKTKEEMLAAYRQERGLPYGDQLPFAELKAFTYWLFKFRVRWCDPAKVASDTGRGLTRLAALDRIRTRDAVAVVPPPAETIESYAL